MSEQLNLIALDLGIDAQITAVSMAQCRINDDLAEIITNDPAPIVVDRLKAQHDALVAAETTLRALRDLVIAKESIHG